MEKKLVQGKKVWPHLFSNTLDDLPYKWYKIEEAHRETFTQKDLKENFIKDFSFNLAETNLTDAIKEIRDCIKQQGTKIKQKKRESTG